MNNNEKIYQKLKLKADSIKNEFNDTKDNAKKYDHFNLKHIIKENLIEMKNNNFLSDKNKFEDFINEERLIRDDDFIYQSVEGNKLKSDINNSQSNCFDELNELELIAINKAKELESQINVINSKRVQFIVKDFKEKLVEVGEHDLSNFNKILFEEYKSALKNINDEHSKKLENINTLQSKLNKFQEFIKDLNQQLKEEKIELNSAYDKYLTNMENEKDFALETYKFDQNKFIENRVNIFKKHLDSI